MNEIFEKIGKIGIVPVIKIDDAERPSRSQTP